MSKTTKKRKIAVICFLDGYANSNKPTEIKQFLEKNGHTVEYVNTINIFRLSVENKRLINDGRPQINIFTILLFFTNNLQKIEKHYFHSKSIFSFLLLLEMIFRAKILSKMLSKLDYDFIIGESPIDSLVFLAKIGVPTLYDCATPFADELYFGNQITKFFYQIFLDFEKRVYKTVTYLSFHWEAYINYTKKYHYNGRNIIILNGGCSPTKIPAKFNPNPKIVYFGYLGGYWINLPLLSRLTKLYPNIDVYGAPAPDARYKINYKGYSNSSILKDYQFGLITISKDRLRREGFSAKHLEYLLFGLPVLVPEWRANAHYFRGSITYNEDNFLNVVKKYSQQTEWSELSNSAYSGAKEFTWEKSLFPLLKLIKNAK